MEALGVVPVHQTGRRELEVLDRPTTIRPTRSRPAVRPHSRRTRSVPGARPRTPGPRSSQCARPTGLGTARGKEESAPRGIVTQFLCPVSLDLSFADTSDPGFVTSGGTQRLRIVPSDVSIPDRAGRQDGACWYERYRRAMRLLPAKPIASGLRDIQESESILAAVESADAWEPPQVIV